MDLKIVRELFKYFPFDLLETIDEYLYVPFISFDDIKINREYLEFLYIYKGMEEISVYTNINKTNNIINFYDGLMKNKVVKLDLSCNYITEMSFFYDGDFQSYMHLSKITKINVPLTNKEYNDVCKAFKTLCDFINKEYIIT